MIAIADFRKLTRIEQSLFALPFALSGALLSGVALSWQWLWMVLAVLLARISGMAFNQLIDRHIDASNCRTQGRPIPSGKVSAKEAAWIASGCLLAFIFLCLYINVRTFLLCLPAAFLIVIYSYMKRIHWSCHFVLGAIHCFGPIMAYTALADAFSLQPLFLGAGAAFLIAGNDMIYAIQDYEFDCASGLYSLPARLGIKNSLHISRLCHLATLVMLFSLGLSADFPYLYYLLLLVVGAIFVLFQSAVSKNKVHYFAICNASVAFSILFFLMISLWLVLL